MNHLPPPPQYLDEKFAKHYHAKLQSIKNKPNNLAVEKDILTTTDDSNDNCFNISIIIYIIKLKCVPNF